MSTTTSRLALVKPAVSDMMNIGDNVLNDNYTTLDGAVGAPTFTSATRPGSPWAGRTIFESDTGNLMFWDGSAWKYWGNDTLQREHSAADVGIQITTVASETLHKSLTFAATQNRRYRIDFNHNGEYSGTNTNGSYVIRIRWAAGSSVATSDTLLRETYIKCNAAGNCGRSMADMVELNYTGSTGTITVGVFVLSSDANNVSFDGAADAIDLTGSLIIRDWGAS